jgi:hypothetical protein
VLSSQVRTTWPAREISPRATQNASKTLADVTSCDRTLAVSNGQVSLLSVIV